MSRKYALAILLGFLAISLFAQDFYEMGTVKNIQLFFTQTNWDQILDHSMLRVKTVCWKRHHQWSCL